MRSIPKLIFVGCLVLLCQCESVEKWECCSTTHEEGFNSNDGYWVSEYSTECHFFSGTEDEMNQHESGGNYSHTKDILSPYSETVVGYETKYYVKRCELSPEE